MLKTIRLSKNIFSLTERLPKSKYRSPKAGGLESGPSLLANNTSGMKSKATVQTIQHAGSSENVPKKQNSA